MKAITVAYMDGDVATLKASATASKAKFIAREALVTDDDDSTSEGFSDTHVAHASVAVNGDDSTKRGPTDAPASAVHDGDNGAAAFDEGVDDFDATESDAPYTADTDAACDTTCCKCASDEFTPGRAPRPSRLRASHLPMAALRRRESRAQVSQLPMAKL